MKGYNPAPTTSNEPTRHAIPARVNLLSFLLGKACGSAQTRYTVYRIVEHMKQQPEFRDAFGAMTPDRFDELMREWAKEVDTAGELG